MIMQPTSILAICAAVAGDVCGSKEAHDQLNIYKSQAAKITAGVQSSTTKCEITFDDIKTMLSSYEKISASTRERTLLYLLTEMPVLRNEDYIHLSWKANSTHFVDAKSGLIHIAKGKSKNSVRDIPVPVDLMEKLVRNKSYGPDGECELLLPKIDRKGKNFVIDAAYTTSGLTKFINRTLGCRVGTTALRNLYVASRYGRVSAAEINANARAMGHSSQTSQSVYAKTADALNGVASK